MNQIHLSRIVVGAAVGIFVLAGIPPQQSSGWQEPALAESADQAPREPEISSATTESTEAAPPEPAPLPFDPDLAPLEESARPNGDTQYTGSRISFGDPLPPLRPTATAAPTPQDTRDDRRQLSQLDQQRRHSPESALSRVQQVLETDPHHPVATAILAEIQLESFQFVEALATVESGLEHSRQDRRLRRLRAESLLRLARWQDAQRAIDELLEQPEASPEELAALYLLQGDLKAQRPNSDVREALESHWKAANAAAEAVRATDPETRVEGVRLSLKAYLAIARDIGQGKWRNGQQSFERWIRHAQETAEALAPAAEAREWRFDIQCRALEASAASAGQIDPAPYATTAKELAVLLLDETTDLMRRAQIQGRLGAALLEAADAMQDAGQHDVSADYSRDAQRLLEAALSYRNETAEYRFRLIRAYALLGAERALAGDHRAAVTWYNKAEPLLRRPGPPAGHPQSARFGKALVNMSVSYWRADQYEKALTLTEFGLQAMQHAVEHGQLDRNALADPLRNLTHMNRILGNTEQADRYQARLVDYQTPVADNDNRD